LRKRIVKNDRFRETFSKYTPVGEVARTKFSASSWNGTAGFL